MRIERLLKTRVHCAGDIAGRLRPPAFLGEANAVLAGDHAAPSENLRKQFIESEFDPIVHGQIVVMRRHNIDVNVAVAGMAEGRNWKTMTRLEFTGELDQIDETTARDDDVLVEFRQTCGAKRVAEFATQRPQFLRAFLGRRERDVIWFPAGKQGFKRSRIGRDTLRPPVEIYEQVRVAFRERFRHRHPAVLLQG